MVRLGCLLVLVLFAVLMAVGRSTATRHGHSAWLGAAFGVTTWFAVLSAYAAALSIADWRLRKKKPVLIGVSCWVVPVIWLCFIASAVGAVMLYARIRAA
jgi:hypothetical protein